jgi:hypothetical protein
LLDEFTRFTGYHRKSPLRLLNAEPVREVLIYVDGKPVKLKPEKSSSQTARKTGVYHTIYNTLNILQNYDFFHVPPMTV